ncbi:MAG TPA: hypothetical protein VFN37_04215 [Candidatus Baltobacteraceae bacterium]|nr:hypothetical protein [Candidatus Baltobacteraceae bacterium]
MRRVLVVAFLLLLSALLWAPDVRRLAGHPLGIVGLSFNYDGVVTAVDPRAAYSGVRIGDRIDLSRATLEDRASYAGLGTADSRMHVNIPMLRGPTSYTAHMITFPEGAERIQMIWLRDAAQIFVMLAGALVVLRRPSPATWGFFLVLFSGTGPVNVVYLLGPLWWRVVGINLFWLVANNGVGEYGAIIFAIYLLHSGPLPRWRRITQAITLVLAAVMFAVSLWHANTLAFARAPNGSLWIAYSLLSALPLFVAPLVLIATYFESSPNLRERLRWIIGGFVLSAVCNALDQAGSQGNLGLIQESYVVHSLLVAGTYLFIAVPVAYAVLKHHIIDVTVAISRATVYTALSVFTVGAFALVDFFFSHALDQKSAGLVADIGLALILGFSFNTLHQRVDSFVDRFLFHKRHRAEEHVAGLAAAMAYAHSKDHVCAMLTDEPVRAFDLAGAKFVSELAHAEQQIQTLSAYLEARRCAVRVTDSQWALNAAAAVPVFSHGTLDALVLYGLHQNGTDLDAEELALLEQLGISAGVALDRLEAEELRKEIALLRGAPA